MSPLNKIVWFKAFKAKAPQVTVEGKTYNLDYKSRPGFVWVKPANGDFSPCGWFDLRVVTKPDWVGYDNKVREVPT